MIKGVIFDMDGTITVPYINWKNLRDRIGATSGQTIMEYINSLPPDRFAWANDELLKAEMEAASCADKNDGITELVETLVLRGIRLSIVTNSHRAAMLTVVKRYSLRFDILLAREDGEIKPSPDLIYKALAGMDLESPEVITIGDGRYDLEACEHAGVRCIYLTHGTPTLDHDPSVGSLHDILPLIESELG